MDEEILFRGFIGKRLIDRFGFQIGNTTQTVLFGPVHGILLKSAPAGQGITTAGVVSVVVLTGRAGYLLGYLTEKPANGSIIPAWIAHGLVNALSYSTAVFLA
jgi:membrane protease YdiL (CAAX protease family)